MMFPHQALTRAAFLGLAALLISGGTTLAGPPGRGPAVYSGGARPRPYGVDAGPSRGDHRNYARDYDRRSYFGSYGGFYPGYYGGFYPGYYDGFYSNGFSRYGPPVPTYGPVPGVFGGSDQRFDDVYPGYGAMLYGVRPYQVAVPPPPLPPQVEPVTRGNEPPLAPPAAVRGVRVEVRVPDPAATVFFDGHRTRQSGTTRSFESPPLEPGETYTYEVRAQWRENGREVTRSRSFEVRAGDQLLIDFTQPDPAKFKPVP